MGRLHWPAASARIGWRQSAAALLLLASAAGPSALVAIAAEPVTTSITIQQAPAYVYAGDDVTVTAIVSPNPGDGTLRFSREAGSHSFTTDVAVDPATGTATLTFAAIPFSDQVRVDAWFKGTTGFASSETWALLDVRHLPNVVITETPSPATASTSATIAFHVSPGISTKCRLDGAPASPCTSPAELHGVSEGSHTFDVIPFGDDGRDGHVASTTWFADFTGPVPGDVELDGGGATTNLSTLDLVVPATDALSGVERVRVSSTGEVGPDGLLALGAGASPPGFERAWSDGPSLTWHPDRTGGSGPRTVWVQWIDVAGNASSIVSRTIDLRVANARLAGGAWQTASPTIAFALDGVDPGEVVATLISNGPNFQNGHLVDAVEFPGIPLTWALDDPLAGGTSAIGSKIVYVQWKDSRGRWSDVIVQAIADRPLIPVDVAFDEGPVTASPIVHAAFVIADLAGRSVNVAFEFSCDGSTWAIYKLSWQSQAMRLDDNSAGCPPDDGARTVHLRWQLGTCCVGDADASTERIVPITLDSTAPPAPTSPEPILAGAGSALAAGGAPIRVSWSSTGGASYEVRQSTDGHAFGAPTTVLTTTLARVAEPGHAYRFSVRAIDAGGKFGAWSIGSTLEVRAIAQGSRLIDYDGRWARSIGERWWGGTAKHSSKAGSTATFTYTGRSFAWVGLTGSNRGKARVFVNGKRVATVDLHSKATHAQRIVWSASYASSAKRTVTIKVLGTSGRSMVDIDGFIVGS